ncbi:MAG: TIGR00159 family protein [Candidatus Margulisiibacteriota bacterium]|nr:MAG: TIGR00159 family protein [Candidatus Margulisbacteria bacterium GWD2_39_127]OGI04300.1 MAG: TIGR00159 family protein [Candidatus Margulisbacteria bacterium GWF2_38_17]OGI11795.1 MAG: TIGR00159 family protein [Candidatus Margulisbacteria bacterium GWE2_39_32]PZM79834.1 MAG: TIGR00159 family protein [Candidatus Margulisiibacteriota bacterium]HAR62743.1 TIGR00159 family protein [Candidatus Margulisiibacteriota bacterium]
MPSHIIQLLFKQHYISLIDVIDIFFTYLLIYYTLLWLQRTRAFQLLKGLGVLFVVYVLTNFIGLYTIDWLMQKLITFFFIVLIVVFQPELRSALEKIGRQSFFSSLFKDAEKPKTGFLQQIIKSVHYLSENKKGALIVLERLTGLNEYVESGVLIDAIVSSELLTSIFIYKNPIHDGAVIIRNNRLSAAGCLLPLTESRVLDKRLGTRHRAALGLTEQSDALVIVVSEETGIISIAENGTLTRYLSKETLEERLFSSYKTADQENQKQFSRFFKRYSVT